MQAKIVHIFLRDRSSGNIVTIGGSVCEIESESTTEIICETGAHSPPEMTKVRVEVGSNGIATQVGQATIPTKERSRD